jgi:hypothetical protein
MPDPNGFAWSRTKDGQVRISHHGRVVTRLAGSKAERFLARAEHAPDSEAQHLMARATGNYRHGNERN